MNAVCEARQSRQSPAVLLKKVLDVRQHNPSARIAVIEGKDDIGVWPVWFERAHSNANIEPIPASGKRNVLRAREGIRRNREIDNFGIIYVVDRDYDDNSELSDLDDVYCTERYSIENYFLCSRVMGAILNVSFACAGDVATKEKVRDHFVSFMDAYHGASFEIQFRAFVTRRLRVQGAGLPTRFSDIVATNDSLEVCALRLDQISISLPSLSSETEAELRSAFSDLDFIRDWRGKFHLLALKYFMMKAQGERDTPTSRSIFSADKPATDFKFSGLNLGELASFSDLPEGLDDFLQANLSRSE